MIGFRGRFLFSSLNFNVFSRHSAMKRHFYKLSVEKEYLLFHIHINVLKKISVLRELAL